MADTTGMFLVNATIMTFCREEEFARVECHGSERVDTGRMPFYIWLSEHELREGDVVTIALREHGVSWPVPKTLAELHPEADQEWVKPPAEEVRELSKAYAARPLRRRGHVIQVESSFGAPVEVQTAQEGGDLCIHCHWQMDRPGEARFYISSSATDGNTGAHSSIELLRTKLPLGESISLTLSSLTGTSSPAS